MLQQNNHNIILPKYFRMVKKKGSSLTFSAHGWWGKEKNCKPAEKIRQPESEDGSAGGGQGEECRAVRASKPRRLFVRTEASREVFFSLIEKNFRGRAKEKIVKKTSLLDTRARRAAAGRERTIWFRATTRAARGQSGFCSKKVRISSNRHHQIELVASLGASPLASAGSFASKAKGFLKSISSRSAARRQFTNKICFARRAMSRFFFVFGEKQSEILLNCRCGVSFFQLQLNKQFYD